MIKKSESDFYSFIQLKTEVIPWCTYLEGVSKYNGQPLWSKIIVGVLYGGTFALYVSN